MTVELTLPMTDQRVSHVWKTTIQETIEGAEKRSALFTWPRVNLENKIQMSTDNERNFISAHSIRSIYDLWDIPIISDKTVLTAQATSGQKIITVTETDYRHFYEGRECVLIDPDDWESYEIVEIDTVDSSTQITAVGNLVATWPADTEIYPLYQCSITDTLDIDSDFPGIEKIEILAEESFESQRSFSYTLPTIDTAVYPVYNSLNLFLNRPRRPIQNNYRHPFNLFGGIGLKTSFSTYDHTRLIFDRNFQLKTKKSIYDLLNFFDAKQGQLGTFYTPTWLNDIVVSTGFDAADTTINTSKIYLTAAEITGEHIYIEFPDETYVAREITGRPTETSITIDSAIGTTVATSSISKVRVSFLHETRFNQDEIAIDYVFKENIAKIDLGFNIL